MSFAEDPYMENFVDVSHLIQNQNEHLDINLIKHKLYRSYDDNKALRVAREKKIAPFQESNCKRVLVFDEYSCDSEKETKHPEVKKSQHVSPKMDMYNYHHPNNFSNSPEYHDNNNKYKKKNYYNNQKEIKSLREEIDELKRIVSESQTCEHKTNKRLKNLEREFYDFKTNLSNYLLTKNDQEETMQINDINHQEKEFTYSQPINDALYTTDSTNFNGNYSCKGFSSQDTIKNNNGNMHFNNTENYGNEERHVFDSHNMQFKNLVMRGGGENNKREFCMRGQMPEEISEEENNISNNEEYSQDAISNAENT